MHHTYPSVCAAYRAPHLSLRVRSVPCTTLIPPCAQRTVHHTYPSVCAAYRAPHLSLRVRHTLTLFQGSWRFSCENAARLIVAHLAKKCLNTVFRTCRTNPEANHKSVVHFLSKHRHTKFTNLHCFQNPHSHLLTTLEASLYSDIIYNMYSDIILHHHNMYSDIILHHHNMYSDIILHHYHNISIYLVTSFYITTLQNYVYM